MTHVTVPDSSPEREPERELALMAIATHKLLGTLDLRIIHRVLVQTVSQLMQADQVAVVEFDASITGLRFTEPRSANAIDEADHPHVHRVFTTGEPSHFQHSTAQLTQAEVDFLHEQNIHQAELVALRHGTQTTGVLVLGYASARTLSDAEQQLAAQLAQLCGLALVNARAFNKLTERQDRLTAILNSVTEGSIVIDALGVVTLVNPQLKTLWGVPASRLLDKPITQLMAEPDLHIAAKLGFAEEELLELLVTIRAGLALNIEKRAYQIGNRYVERTGAPILNQLERAIGWVILLRDTTEEHETQRLRQGLFDMIVHDLRSPLTSALTSIHLLRDRLLIDTPHPAARRALDAAQKACRRMLALVNNLLDVTRLEASGKLTLQIESVDVYGLASDVIAELGPSAHEANITLNNSVSSALDTVLMDAEKMSRVLMNLVDNALKFTPNGGEVAVSAKMVELEGQRWLKWSVLDTGPGIPTEYLDKVFNRFVQVAGQNARRPGTGLGLSFCKLAVEAHGGKIWAENRLTGGSAFHVLLPA